MPYLHPTDAATRQKLMLCPSATCPRLPNVSYVFTADPLPKYEPLRIT